MQSPWARAYSSSQKTTTFPVLCRHRSNSWWLCYWWLPPPLGYVCRHVAAGREADNQHGRPYPMSFLRVWVAVSSIINSVECQAVCCPLIQLPQRSPERGAACLPTSWQHSIPTLPYWFYKGRSDVCSQLPPTPPYGVYILSQLEGDLPDTVVTDYNWRWWQKPSWPHTYPLLLVPLIWRTCT